MDYKNNLKVALQHLELAEIYNPKLAEVINEVAKAYRGRPKVRKKQEVQLPLFDKKVKGNYASR